MIFFQLSVNFLCISYILSEHNFRWVFFTRFLMQQGVATVVGFLEYWLGDMVVLPSCWQPEKAVAVILLPLLLSAAILYVFILL